MSMNDDIFDLDYMIKEKKKPNQDNYRAWNSLMRAFNALEQENEMLRVMKSNLQVAMSIAKREL